MPKKRGTHRKVGHILPPGSVGKKQHGKSIRSQWQRGKSTPKPWHREELPCALCGALTANNFAPSTFNGWMCMGCALECM
jgi:hypothetical protein